MNNIFVFGKEDVSGNVYPILGELGGGSGSVEVNLDLSHAQSCVLKRYPKLLHYIMPRHISVDLPTPLKGIQSRVGALEEMLIDLNKDYTKFLCGFRFELAISDTTLLLMDCYDVARNYNMDAEGVPEREMIETRLTPVQYIDNLTNALADAKEE